VARVLLKATRLHPYVEKTRFFTRPGRIDV
jgi:hypothetical protein